MPDNMRAYVPVAALRERVTIQSKLKTKDLQGGRSWSWADEVTVWASVEPLRAVERLQAAAVGASLSYVVRIRHRTDVTTEMRLRWGTRFLEITGALREQGPQDYLRLDCSETLAAVATA